IGLGYTMAFTTAVIGHLNILTVTFAPILVGIAIDFGVHLISRYEEEIRRGRSNEEALRKAIVYTGMGVVTGALTTAGAFLAMAATDFRGIQEMGIICGGGLAICLVPMMTLLPVMLLRGRQNVIDHALGTKLERRAKIENLWLTRPRQVMAIAIASCIAALIPARKVYFDYNLLEMQSKGLAAVVFGEKLIKSANKSVLYGAIVADSLENAVRIEERLTNLSSVASVDLAGIDNMARYLTEDQSKKLTIVSQIKQDVADVQFVPLDPAPVNVKELLQTLFSFNGYVGLALGEVPKEEVELRKQLVSLRQSISELNQQLRVLPTNETTLKLASFQQALFRDIRDTFTTLRTQDDRGRLGIDDLPEPIRKRFIGASGKYLVQVYPKEEVRSEERRVGKECRSRWSP